MVISLGAFGGILGNLGWVLIQLGGEDPRLVSNPINAVFQYVLIVLLLHSQSREHQRIWFS